VVKAQLAGLAIAEVPTTLAKDGRSRPPHLRSWRDGWRHLKFLLLFAPRWLYVYPGAALLGLSLIAFAALLFGDVQVGAVRFGIDTLLFASAGILVAVQTLSFGLVASLFGERERYWFPGGFLTRAKKLMTINTGCLAGGGMMLCGAIGAVTALLSWGGSGFGDMRPESLMRLAIPSVTLGAVGLQVMLTCFLAELMAHPRRDHVRETL